MFLLACCRTFQNIFSVVAKVLACRAQCLSIRCMTNGMNPRRCKGQLKKIKSSLQAQLSFTTFLIIEWAYNSQ